MSYPQPPPGTPPAMYQPYPGAQQQLYYASAPQIPYRLFDSGAVLLATFFGSPLAGAIVMAVNYGRLGKSGKAFLAVVLGLAATALLVEIGLSGKTQYSPLGIVFLLATWQIARMTQGKDVQEHTARGGQLGSKWTAFFIALATLAALFGVVVYAIATNQIQVPGTPNQNSKNFVTIGTKDQVIYSGTATKADATALGNALKADGYFQDRGVTVQIDKGSSGTTISFAIQDGAWNQTSTLSSFEEIVREVAPSVGGFPVQLDLDDSKMDVEKTSTVGEVTFDGGDAVYYEGSATQAQAQALGQQFKSISFFTGKGANVVLTKHDDGATLAFVVADGTWNNPTMVSAFETITRSVASTVGGLPIDMRLVNTQMQVEKDEELK